MYILMLNVICHTSSFGITHDGISIRIRVIVTAAAVAVAVAVAAITITVIISGSITTFEPFSFISSCVGIHTLERFGGASVLVLRCCVVENIAERCQYSYSTKY